MFLQQTIVDVVRKLQLWPGSSCRLLRSA